MNVSDIDIIVTGGGSGIGRHLVERLSTDARCVAVLERDSSACSELQTERPNVRCYVCDVTDYAALQTSIQRIEDDGFNFDVLINNAGVIYSAPLVNVLSRTDRVHSIAEWHRVIAGNLSSTFYVTGLIVDRMISRRRKGVVINMSSVAARGNEGQSAYAAAKAGVEALTRTWAKELSVLGIRFAAVAPGFMDTPSTRAALSDATLNKLLQRVPLRRLGTVDNVYQAVRFIIENDYVNGTIAQVDGGLVF